MMAEPMADLVSAAWLARHTGMPGLRIAEVSLSLAAGLPAQREAYERAHIPGAVFLDLDALGDPAASLPHTLAPAAHVGAVVGSLGIGNDDSLVLYNRTGIHTSARAWWLFKAYGHLRVAVLDGGLPAWLDAGGVLERTPVALPPADYRAAQPWAHVCTQEDVLAACEAGVQIVDARSRGRFQGEEAEPRPGLRPGHIPGSHNLPYTELLDPASGTLLGLADLQAVFDQAQVDTSRPIICTCGSGVTACVIQLALTRLGARSAKVYDGSWAQWGATPELPVAVGPGAERHQD